MKRGLLLWTAIAIVLSVVAVTLHAEPTSPGSEEEPDLTVHAVSVALQQASLNALADGDIVVYITKTGKKYHRGSCRYLSKSKIKTTLKKAKAQGYTPCKVCKPPG